MLTGCIQVVVLFLIVFDTGQADKAFQDYVKTQSLQVPYGRTVLIDSRTQLVVKYPQRSYCRIDVLRDNPLSETNGFIEPDVFQCDFKLGDVRYTHLGSKFHTRDFVKFQLRIDTVNQTQIVPFQLTIEVIFTPMEIVSRNLPLVVPSVGHVSSSIERDILDFVFDTQSQSCHVALLRSRLPLPRYGELVNVTTPNSVGTRFECNDFFTRDIRYVHKKLQSSNRDYVPFVVEITDKTLSQVKREYFQIIVRILGARVNERPTASFQASNTLEVKDQALGAITTSSLAAVDLETKDQNIIFNISKPLGKGQGQLINLDDPYRPLTAFYQEDLQHLKIAYRPPTVQNDRSQMFQVVLNAIDAEGAVSDPIPLLIMVRPTNVNAPMVILNAGLTLFEGQARPLTTDNLQIADNDNINDVMLEVIGGLQHGTLRILGRPVNLFLATDLRHPDVIYHHDGSETYSDNIVFKMTDETHMVEFVFPINIAAVDDQPPYLTYNTGLLINEGSLVTIDQYMLSASDVDSDDLKIKYTVILNDTSPQTHPTPVGVFCLRTKRISSSELLNWVLMSDGFYEKNTTQFTQEDIVQRRVFYRHLDGEIFRDQVNFVVSDNAAPPNVSPIQQFNILINKVDDLPPRQYPGSTLFVAVGEASKVFINKTVLRYTDGDSDDTELTYTVTNPPRFIDRINETDEAGKLILMDSGSTISKFTQLQVNHGKIGYQAPDIEVGVLPRHAQFTFSVSDSAGNVVRNQVVAVLITPINNKPPKVNITLLQVDEFSQAVIDMNIIKVFDEDTSLDEIRMSFSRLPIYGVLQFDAIPMQKGQLFTFIDVFSSRITYQHVKFGELSDEAELTVDDGVHKKVSLLDIVLNSSPPNKTKASLNITMSVKEQSREKLHLPCCLDMPQSKEIKSALKITTPPRLGRLLLNNKTSSKFMVDDVISGRVSYEHTGDETGFQGDEDQFDIVFNESMIMAGRQYDSLKVTTRIVPVDNQPPRVVIKMPLTVQEAGKAKLSQQHIIITDPDTRQRDITCRIDVQPTRGYLENVSPSPGSEISNAGKRITSFKVGDITNGNVNYVQDRHQGSEPRVDWVALSCMDANNTSPRYLLNIIILPTNDEAPHLYYRDFITEEGSELVIDVTLLNAMDDDAPLDELIFHVLAPPSHGVITDTRVEGHAPVSKFTLTQIRKSTSIVYIHDGSETRNDSIHLAVSDGVHNTSKIIPIRILPVDDELPRLVVNKGLRLRSLGESDLLTVDRLQASDIDSPDDNITFIIRVEPKAGVLQKLSWDGLKNLTKHDEFTQTDVKRRLIVYSQDKKMPTSRDEMFFDVTDGTNTLLNQPFYVFIPNHKPIPPIVINKALKLNQGATVTLTTDFLSAHDLNSQNTKLKYTIIKHPLQGHLELSANPGNPVSSFTQLDIASNRLLYVHTSDEESTSDSFDFEVADDSKRMVITRRFLITLINVDNKKPVVTYSTIYVIEGRSGSVNPYVLRADDKDSTPESLIFTVTRVPLHGMILKSNVYVRRFSQADVNAGDITYLHDGSDTASDSFFLTITDGTHKQFYLSTNTHQLRTKPFQVIVNITAVDNRSPQIVHNKGITDLQIFHGNVLGFTLDPNILSAEDRDSDDLTLIYRIIKPPVYGKLTKSLSSNTTIINFTQENIKQRQIRYVLLPGLSVTSDVFTFSVSDPAGNTLPSQTFSIVWSRVELMREFYKVNETEGVVEVSLKRAGFLGDSSFVRVQLRGVTAHLHADFSSFGSMHVQFSPGQTHAKWKLRIVDDNIYESRETLELRLVNPMNCIIGEKRTATIAIDDPEDLPSVKMVHPRQAVQENAGQILVPLKRTGDLSNKLQVMCVTRTKSEKGWAMGTFPSSVMSYSDFLIRKNHSDSVITINKGQDTSICRVNIIDDSLYEDEERFTVELNSYHGSHVNSRHSNTEVIILPDQADEPIIEFDRPQYVADESDSTVKITIKRTGTDLSTFSKVFLRSKESEPTSAVASQDYIPVSNVVHFAPYVTTQSIHVTIVDDTGNPKVEGEETFELLLRTPINARLGLTAKAVVIINDTYSDLPIVHFKDQSITVKEDSGLQEVILTRYGDLSYTSLVRCYTKQDTAKAGKDFAERPNTDASNVVFNTGESTKRCEVMVTDDDIYEEEEERFRLVVESTSYYTRIGSRNSTVIRINDQEDKPVIQFDSDRLFVIEPKTYGQETYVTVTILRTGDPTVAYRVNMYTTDGTAKAGSDYEPISKVLEFTGNTSSHKEQIKILHNKNRKIRRAFSIRIKSRQSDPSHIAKKKTTVYIEKSVVSAVTFPLEPKVVSLRHYDDVNGDATDIPLGYPVVCVTACDPKYPRYPETGLMCDSQGIDNKLTQYRWQMTKSEGSTFTDITADTFFTQTNRVTLDSIYIHAGIRIRCIAQAATSRGELGFESTSQLVVIKGNKGMCLPRDESHVGSEVFASTISFTGARNDGKANMVHLNIQIPHFDGMIPIISTRLPDIRDMLSPGAIRVAQHKCSNVLDGKEIQTTYGFLNNGIKEAIIREAEPYQFSAKLRGNDTVQFYNNLNLESCVWNFESYYQISELIEQCGATLISRGHVKRLTQSQLSLRIPLYVSYVYRSKSDWLHYDHTTFLRLTLVYDTAVLLKDGVQTPADSVVQGSLWPTSIKISNSDKRLVVRFKTKTKFKGIFLIKKEGFNAVGMVMSRDLPHLGFKLRMVSTQKTYNHPVQQWEFKSDYAAQDYTGSYYIKLIPCLANMGMAYSEPLICNPKTPVSFNLPIRFQQIPEPVPSRFTLAVRFNLMADKKLWLTGERSNTSIGRIDSAFSRDSKIYGRISLSNSDRQGMGYQVYTEKVFLCSSDGEFIPSYDPSKNSFGCLEDSNYLIYRLKVLDRQSPSSVASVLGKAAFQAKFASDVPEAAQLEHQTHSDGFVMNSAPLFQVPRAQKWFMHAVYSVSSDQRKAKRLPRTAEYQISTSTFHEINQLAASSHLSIQQSTVKRMRTRRSKDSQFLDDGQGTNMKVIQLIYDSFDKFNQFDESEKTEKNNVSSSNNDDSNLVNPLVIGISVFCGVLLCALIVVWILYKRKGRQQQAARTLPHAVSTPNSQGTQV